jgi:glutaryl-CoA dehydrogenase
MAFSATDPFDLAGRLTPDERAIEAAATQFAETVLRPRVEQDYANETAGRDIVEACVSAGFGGLLIPADGGGRGASQTAFGLVCRALERVDSGYRTSFMANEALALLPIQLFGSPEQRSRYIGPMCAGRLIGAFGFTEPDAGSDPAGIAAVARKEGGGYRVSGRKIWITNAPIADLFVVWAKSEAHDGQLRAFLLERGMAGLTTPASEGKLSLRASMTGDIVMEDVELGEEHLLAGAAGLRAAFTCMNQARLGTAWGVLGAAEDCFRRVLAHGLGRAQFGRPLASMQLYQKKLADMVTELALATEGSLRLARIVGESGSAPELASLMKRNNCRMALEIARTARDMLGAEGIRLSAGVMRHVQNLESVSSYEGTDDVQALILGRVITGLSAFA